MNFPSRKLGRTEARVPSVVWRLEPGKLSTDVLLLAESAEANWLLIPHEIPAEFLADLRTMLGERVNSWLFIVGVEMEALRQRVVPAFDEKLTALGIRHCAAVCLENPTSAGVKAGWPFHRLGQLRDRGATSLFFVDAHEVADAEWIVDQTPAHAVIVPFSERDQLAKYRLFKLAEEMGVAVVGRAAACSGESVSDINLRAAETGLTTQILSLPEDLEAWENATSHLGAAMSASERDASWQVFCALVPEPAKPRGAHPPEFGA